MFVAEEAFVVSQIHELSGLATFDNNPLLCFQARRIIVRRPKPRNHHGSNAL
jgi:hypothetical protein